jgi:hypothetical protein
MGRNRDAPKPYKSKLEHRIHKGPLKRLEYEPRWAKTSYIIHKDYIPDYVHPDKPNILYEAKGRFRTWEEAKKYIHIIESNPHITIRFIITNPNNRAYPQTKMKMGDWLTKHGFEWCLEMEVPEEWRN